MSNVDYFFLRNINFELWGVSREEFLSKIPEIDCNKILFGEEFFKSLEGDLKKSKIFSKYPVKSLLDKFSLLFLYDPFMTQILIPNNKLLSEQLSLTKSQVIVFSSIVKSFFLECGFSVKVVKYFNNSVEVSMLGSCKLLDRSVDFINNPCNARIVTQCLGEKFLSNVKMFEEKEVLINFHYGNFLKKNDAFLGDGRGLFPRELGLAVFDLSGYYDCLFYNKVPRMRDKWHYVCYLSGYRRRLDFSSYIEWCLENNLLYNYKLLNIQKVWLKLFCDHLYRIHTKGFCSLNDSKFVPKLVYFEPRYEDLSCEQKEVYVNNLKYSASINDSARSLRRFQKRVNFTLSEQVSHNIRVNLRVTLLPMLALLLKSKEFLDKSGIFSAERYIGVYTELAVELRKIEKYNPINSCIRYQVVQSVIELYIQGYEKEVIYPMFFECAVGFTKELVYEFIDTVMEVTFKQIPGLQLLIEFVRKYARYRVKKYGTVLSKLEDSVIEYNYRSKSMTIKRLLGDMLERLKNKVIYKCRVKMLEESVAKNCCSVENTFIIHPCDLDILMSYYNAELVNVKNMSFEEFIDDSEIFDPNNEFNIKNQKVIKKLESLVNNQSAISDNEIKASKYTIAPYKPIFYLEECVKNRDRDNLTSLRLLLKKTIG